jgi:hypothetical protein
VIGKVLSDFQAHEQAWRSTVARAVHHRGDGARFAVLELPEIKGL